MANLTRNNWQNGWCPSDDDVNGRKDGYLRGDNLTLDDNGILTLTKGTKILGGPYEAPVINVFSKYFNNNKFQFIHLESGRVITQTGIELLTDGSPVACTFLSALGNVFIFSGLKFKRFDGGATYDVGIASSSPPNVEGLEGPRKEINEFSAWQLQEGSNLVIGSDYLQFDTLDDKGRVFADYPIDFSDLGSGSSQTAIDRFLFNIRIGDTSLLTKVRIDFLLDSSIDSAGNYYHYEWLNDENSSFQQGINTWTTLSAQRKDFIREGEDSTVDWSNVICIIVSIECTAIMTENVINELRFVGGVAGPLNGRYIYYQQNIRRDARNAFWSKSALSEPSAIVEIINGMTRVTPSAPPVGTDEIWFYRQCADPSVDVTEIGVPRKLDQPYLVKKLIGNANVFTDDQSDEDILLQGQTSNIFLTSLVTLQDEIFDAVGPINGRILYMTFKDILISDLDDPESYDTRHTIRLSGSATEKCLWLAKVSNSLVLVATTSDVYEISGTFNENPDGTLDILIRSLGVSYPPLSIDKFVDKGIVYYIAADGWRGLSGSITERLGGNLDLLFAGQTRYEIAPVAVIPNAYTRYPVAIYKDKLWTFTALKDGTRIGFVFNFKYKAWEYHKLDPTCIFVEEDNKLIAGFGGGSGNYLRQLDIGDQLDESTGQTVEFLTIYDDDNLPRNRKDLFTLKINADTANAPVEIQISLNKGGFTSLGTYQFNKDEHQINISQITDAAFRIALRIKGINLTMFKLYNITVEYAPFPEQLNYFRIPYNNLGSFARKRFVAYAFVIDTLGNNITFTPRIDGTDYPSDSFVLSRKGTYIYYFKSEAIGTDIGGILSGGLFEYYNINLEESVSEKLPTPTKYLVIPANDYGIPNRKRHSSYKFQIHTRSKQVKFTPKLDGSTKALLTFSTSEKRTVEYFFTDDTISIDIGGTLESLEDTPFEFYGVIIPQKIEVLPPRLEYFRIPENNYGIPAKKRVRTMPMEINTNNSNVTFTPIIDGMDGSSTIIKTSHRQTAFHYFNTDIFGIDFSGRLVGTQPFEFYGLLNPVDVEIIPVGKQFDQIGPIEIDRLGKIIAFRLRLIATDGLLPYKIYAEDTEIYSGEIVTIPNIDKTYEVMQFSKTVMGTIFRVEFGPASVFHRYYLEIKLNQSGKDTQSKWIKIK